MACSCLHRHTFKVFRVFANGTGPMSYQNTERLLNIQIKAGAANGGTVKVMVNGMPTGDVLSAGDGLTSSFASAFASVDQTVYSWQFSEGAASSDFIDVTVQLLVDSK